MLVGRPHPVRAAWVLALVLTACQPSEVGPVDNPVPIAQALDPLAVTNGTAATVEVLGLGFVETSEARWNGEARPTTFVDAGRLVVTLSADDLLDEAHEIDVVNPPPGGGGSAVLSLTVLDVPTLSTLSPTSATAVSTTELTLQVEGSGFVTGPSGSRLLWDGVPLPTTVTDDTTLGATVPDYLLRVGRAVAVTVRNPPPQGGTSLPLSFLVENPAPVLTSIAPDSLREEQNYDIVIRGSGFVYGAVVTLGSMEVPISSYSDTSLVAAVSSQTHTLKPGTFPLAVANPQPGGGVSAASDVIVYPKPPTPPKIDYLQPGAALVGGPAFTLAIMGEDFDDLATVTWDGVERPVTFVNTERLEIQVSQADLTATGTVEIVVSNPGATETASAQFGILGPGTYGDRIVTETWGTLEIRTSLLDGSQATIVELPGGGSRVDASPIELKAVYHDSRNIYEVDFSTGARRRVTTPAADSQLQNESWARYSADGAWIYFTGRPSHGREEIWRAPTDRSSDAVRVFGESGGSVGYPAPSHNGTRISYSYQNRLWVRDLTASESADLGVSALVSRWSPGDDWIAYLTPAFELRAIRPDGSGDYSLVGGDVGHGFDFSPDGNSIIATTQSGRGMRIAFPSGTIQYLDGLGQIGSVAWFGP